MNANERKKENIMSEKRKLKAVQEQLDALQAHTVRLTKDVSRLIVKVCEAEKPKLKTLDQGELMGSELAIAYFKAGGCQHICYAGNDGDENTNDLNIELITHFCPIDGFVSSRYDVYNCALLIDSNGDELTHNDIFVSEQMVRLKRTQPYTETTVDGFGYVVNDDGSNDARLDCIAEEWRRQMDKDN